MQWFQLNRISQRGPCKAWHWHDERNNQHDRLLLWEGEPANKKINTKINQRAADLPTSLKRYLFNDCYMILGVASIERCHLTSIGIPSLKIRRSHERLIFQMRIPIPRKDRLYIETGPCVQYYSCDTIIYCHSRVNHRDHVTRSACKRSRAENASTHTCLQNF